MVSDIDPVLAKSLLDTTIKELGKTDIECEKELTIRQKFEQEQITIRHEQEQMTIRQLGSQGYLKKIELEQAHKLQLRKLEIELNWNRLTKCNYVNLR